MATVATLNDAVAAQGTQLDALLAAVTALKVPPVATQAELDALQTAVDANTGKIAAVATAAA